MNKQTEFEASTDRYCRLLRACSCLEQPYAAALFVMLTTLLRPHELMAPSTQVDVGRLEVAGGLANCGGSAARSLPIARVVADVMKAPSGPVPGLLGIDFDRAGTFLSGLSVAMFNGVDPESPELQLGVTSIEAWSCALSALVESAAGPRMRTAVIAYAGIIPLGKRAQADHSQLTNDDYTAVTGLITELVAKAGYGMDDLESAAA